MDADRAVRKLREQIADINAREQDRKERAAAEAEEKKMRETPAMALLLIFVTEHPGGPALAITGERYKLRADGSALHTDSSGAWHVDPQPKDPTTLAVRLREFWESYVKQIEADFYRLKETAVGKSFQSTDVSRWFPRHVDFDTIEGLIHGLADVARKGRLAYQAVTEICEHIPGSRDPRLIRQEREDEIMRAHRERNAAANAIARIQI
ncbi:MAG: hypothetical protein HQ581_23755 [Planctomycetes bacterium]|nr:hypothetical protein [Planctomycetota bacterium]